MEGGQGGNSADKTKMKQKYSLFSRFRETMRSWFKFCSVVAAYIKDWCVRTFGVVTVRDVVEVMEILLWIYIVVMMAVCFIFPFFGSLGMYIRGEHITSAETETSITPSEDDFVSSEEHSEEHSDESSSSDGFSFRHKIAISILNMMRICAIHFMIKRAFWAMVSPLQKYFVSESFGHKTIDEIGRSRNTAVKTRHRKSRDALKGITGEKSDANGGILTTSEPTSAPTLESKESKHDESDSDFDSESDSEETILDATSVSESIRRNISRAVCAQEDYSDSDSEENDPFLMTEDLLDDVLEDTTAAVDQQVDEQHDSALDNPVAVSGESIHEKCCEEVRSIQKPESQPQPDQTQSESESKLLQDQTPAQSTKAFGTPEPNLAQDFPTPSPDSSSPDSSSPHSSSPDSSSPDSSSPDSSSLDSSSLDSSSLDSSSLNSSSLDSSSLDSSSQDSSSQDSSSQDSSSQDSSSQDSSSSPNGALKVCASGVSSSALDLPLASGTCDLEFSSKCNEQQVTSTVRVRTPVVVLGEDCIASLGPLVHHNILSCLTGEEIATSQTVSRSWFEAGSNSVLWDNVLGAFQAQEQSKTSDSVALTAANAADKIVKLDYIPPKMKLNRLLAICSLYGEVEDIVFVPGKPKAQVRYADAKKAKLARGHLQGGKLVAKASKISLSKDVYALKWLQKTHGTTKETREQQVKRDREMCDLASGRSTLSLFVKLPLLLYALHDTGPYLKVAGAHLIRILPILVVLYRELFQTTRRFQKWHWVVFLVAELIFQFVYIPDTYWLWILQFLGEKVIELFTYSALIVFVRATQNVVVTLVECALVAFAFACVYKVLTRVHNTHDLLLSLLAVPASVFCIFLISFCFSEAHEQLMAVIKFHFSREDDQLLWGIKLSLYYGLSLLPICWLLALYAVRTHVGYTRRYYSVICILVLTSFLASELCVRFGVLTPPFEDSLSPLQTFFSVVRFTCSICLSLQRDLMYLSGILYLCDEIKAFQRCVVWKQRRVLPSAAKQRLSEINRTAPLVGALYALPPLLVVFVAVEVFLMLLSRWVIDYDLIRISTVCMTLFDFLSMPSLMFGVMFLEYLAICYSFLFKKSELKHRRKLTPYLFHGLSVFMICVAGCCEWKYPSGGSQIGLVEKNVLSHWLLARLARLWHFVWFVN